MPGFDVPQAGFCLWLPVHDGVQAARKLWQEAGVRVLPGAYLARQTQTENPGDAFVRAALVGPRDEIAEALRRLRQCLYP